MKKPYTLTAVVFLVFIFGLFAFLLTDSLSIGKSVLTAWRNTDGGVVSHLDSATASTEEALNTSRSLQPVAPGRAAIEAPLYALRGEAEKVNACLETLKAHAPAAVQALQETTDRILAKTDPLFFPQQLDEEKIAAFWDWFGDYEDTLKGLLSQEDYEEALTPVGEKLLETFPFLEEIPNVALGKNEQGWVIRLQDLYAVAVMDAYEKLLEACPQYLKDAWQFDVAHT